MKKMIIGIMIGVIISGTVGVIAATIVSSKNVTYQNKTVNNALDELYNEASTGKELVAAAITNKGITTTSADTYETMATNISSIDTDHTEINQKINNLESKHNSDITSINNSIDSVKRNLIKEVSTTFQFNTDGITAGQSGYFTFDRPLEITDDNKIISIIFETNQVADSQGLQLTLVHKNSKIIYGNYYAPHNINVLLTVKATIYYI